MKYLTLFFSLIVLSASCNEAFKLAPADVVAPEIQMSKYIKQLGTTSYGADVNNWDWPIGLGFDPQKKDYFVSYRTESNLGGTPSGVDAGILKVNPNGNIEWEILLNGVGVDNSGTENPSSRIIAVNNGFIYFAITVSGNYLETFGGGTTDIVLIKASTVDGSIVWRKQIGQTTISSLAGQPGFYASASAAGNDSISDVLIHNNKLYFIGTTTSSMGEANGGADILIIVSDLDGNIERIKQIGPATFTAELNAFYPGGNVNGTESALAVLNRDGKIIIAGNTTSSMADAVGNTDLYTMRINPSTLNIEEVFQLGNSNVATHLASHPSQDNSALEQLRALNVDPDSGDIYLAARTLGSLGDNICGGDDQVFLRLNSNLQFQALKQFGTTSQAELACSLGDRPTSISILNGTAYVLGNSTSDISGDNFTSSLDAFLLKLDPSFNVTLKKQYTSASTWWGPINASSNEWCYGFHVTSDGIFFNLGTESSLLEPLGGGEDIFFVSTDLNGSI